MDYLVVLDRTNGVTDIEVAPKFQDDGESLEQYLEEKYSNCDIKYMVCSTINMTI